jgi:hypothetical protein
LENIVIHQNHDYSHINQKGVRLEKTPEPIKNAELIGKWWPLYTYSVWDSTYMLTGEGLKKAFILRRFDPWLQRLLSCVYVWLKIYYPYSSPIVVMGKGINKFILLIRGLFYKRF